MPPDTAGLEPTLEAEAVSAIDSLLPLTTPPESLVTPPPSHTVARVCAGGDVMLGSNLDSVWARQAQAPYAAAGALLPAPDSLLAPLKPLAVDADIVLLNVEGAIGRGPAPRKCRRGSTNCYAFRQEPSVAGALARFARRMVGNVANNHAMDVGDAGFDSTTNYLRKAGVAVTGADSVPTLVSTASGDTVAFLGFSTFQAGLDARDLAAVRRYVSRARERWSRVVVSAHMGAEGRTAQRTPDTTEIYLGEDRGNPVAFAHAAIEAGAAVVFGHGPHVLRGAERWGQGVIFYSLGNLVTYGPFNVADPQNRGALACVGITWDGMAVDPELKPTYQRSPGIVEPDSTRRAVHLVDSLSALDFPATRVWLPPAERRTSR